MSLFAFWRLSIVGLDVSLAERDTFAAKSTLVFDTSHCNDPLIPHERLKSGSIPIQFVEIPRQFEIGLMKFPREVLLIEPNRVIAFQVITGTAQSK